MPAQKNVLHNLRQKSDTSKRIIALTLAAVPAFLIGYAQLYMDSKHEAEKKVAAKQVEAANKKEMAGAVASLGKIFSEGKNTVGSALVDMRKVDKKFLDNKPVQNSVSTTSENLVASSSIDDLSATTSDEVIKISE